MRQSIVPLVITGILAVGAGVAIAGLPSEPPGDGLIITDVPTTTTTPIPFVLDSVAPLPTTTTTSVLEASRTTDGRNLTPTTLPPSRALVERAELAVVTANGAGVTGVAAATAEALGPLGYVAVVATDSAETLDRSTVYHSTGLAAEASRLAVDLGWALHQIAPIAAAPELTLDGEADLIAVVGLDES